MSKRIARIESYIQRTYQTMGERHYAFYWNQGYINCLKGNRIVDTYEGGRLFAYNEKVNMMESLKIGLRKEKIEKEESERMKLERIMKRIDESLQYVCRDNSFTNLEDCHNLMMEAKKALNIYKELISKLYEIRHDDMPFKNCRMVECIQELEDKYYPQPKTTKEKLTGIINEHLDLTRIQSLDGLKKALIKLRDSIED